MPHGITQCYLPPCRGDIPALTPAEAGTRLSDPEGCKAELTLAWSVCVCVRVFLLATSVSPAATVKPIEMPFGVWIQSSIRWGPDPQT